jgi:hypothetical protein
MTLQQFMDNFILDDEPIYITEDINENGGWMARRTDKSKIYLQYNVVGIKSIGKGQLCTVVKRAS